MTVSAGQIAKAKAKGIINVEALAAACDHYQFPFYLALTIVERESPDRPKGIKGGANIFGHDHGGALTDPDGKNVEVTEARYNQFLEEIGAGKTSNGVGPMQLTFKGYHLGPRSMAARGLKAWIPADSMLYGVEILAKSLKHNYDLGMSLEKAWWQTAKSYNGNSSYADAVVERAKFWLTVVGNADTKDPGEDMPITDADFVKFEALLAAERVKIKAAVIAELFTEPNKKKIAEAVWEAEILQPGKDSKDPSDKTWQPRTFLITTYNRVAELLKKP